MALGGSGVGENHSLVASSDCREPQLARAGAGDVLLARASAGDVLLTRASAGDVLMDRVHLRSVEYS